VHGVRGAGTGSPPNDAVPRKIRTPSRSTRARTSADWAERQALDAAVDHGEVDRDVLAFRGACPRSRARLVSTRTPAEEMKVLDGTQSSSTQAPPMPTASTTVTSAPCWAATRAAS
jgi:hypothetical protein